MKLIHCADLHLDSRLNSNLDKEKAKIRKGEILNTFTRLVSFAAEEGVEGILIAGDLFDRNTISATARNTVLHQIRENPQIGFYYLRGNHDCENFLPEREEMPGNLYTFDHTWKTYERGRVAVTGIELTGENAGFAMRSLVLDAGKFNIVMLHGQETDSGSGDRTEVIRLNALKQRGIDYLALGHIHAYKLEKLDARGSYCYPGCLDGRGFDECGEHGFVLLDVNEETGGYTHTFVPFASRKLYTVSVDVSDCVSTQEMLALAKRRVDEMGCREGSLLKLVLTGSPDVACEKDLAYFKTGMEGSFFYVKVCDETGLRVDLEAYRQDQSLKGEFVRMVMGAEDLTEEEKARIVRYGLQAIAGEEVQ